MWVILMIAGQAGETDIVTIYDVRRIFITPDKHRMQILSVLMVSSSMVRQTHVSHSCSVPGIVPTASSQQHVEIQCAF